MAITRKNLWGIYILFKFLGDVVLSLISFFIAYYIRFYNPIFTKFIPPTKGIPRLEKYYSFLPFFVILCVLSYLYCGHYKKKIFDFLDDLLLNLKTSFILCLLFFSFSYIFRTYEYSRIFLLLVTILIFLFFVIWHNFLTIFYKRYLKYLFGKPRVGFICSEEEIERIKKQLKNDKTVKKFFLKNFLNAEDIINFINLRKITELIVDYENFKKPIFQKALVEIDKTDVTLKILISLPISLAETMIDSTLGVPVVSLKPLSLTGINFFIKRSIDILISIFVFTVLIFPLIFISLLIKLDSEGPIFFIHDRVGYKGRTFKCFKFRTMYKDAHKKWWDLLKYSERGDKVLKIKNDPRVTRVGKYLRRWSIDEIPQFFNVLKGDMSIVGPRPQIVEEVGFYDSYAKRRLMVLPGITGLWQISGRADVSFEEMLDLDLYYLENWSLSMDLKIIFKTIFAIFSKKGAY